ncbi:MAG TPA: hypothetical protein VN802_09670 [Stellaceae bacterium]|nr:hypothetical protein [Stellaceae bacterium]
MELATAFKKRAESYERKARIARTPDDRRRCAEIAARCREIAGADADVMIGVELPAPRSFIVGE